LIDLRASVPFEGTDARFVFSENAMPEQIDRSTPSRAIRRRGQHLTKEERVAIQEKFLKTFANNANVRAACFVAGINRSQVYRWQETDEQFSFRFKQAEADANDMLRAAAWKRGVEGVDKPVVSMGKQVRVDGKPLMERVYSDNLLSLLMKARMPEFRDKSQVDATVSINTPQAGNITLNTKDMTDEELSLLHALGNSMRKREKA
jgi:hypothetical protein